MDASETKLSPLFKFTNSQRETTGSKTIDLGLEVEALYKSP